MMDDKDIIQLIEAEQARRRKADEEHLRHLVERHTDGLGPWCARRRAVVRAIAMALLVLLPTGWYMMLPQRTDDRQVLCNVRGDEALVVNRVCSVVGNCADRQVINIMDMR